jgi:hypothetical protein
MVSSSSSSSPETRDEELLQFLNRVATIDGLGITSDEDFLDRKQDKFSPTDSDECAIRKRSSNTEQNSRDMSSQDEEIFLQSLGTVCDTRNEGYWTFEWCHREEMKQYHINAEGKAVNTWSMGKYVGSFEIQDGTRIDRFEDGQHCDETSENRKTSVRFLCCQNVDMPKIVSIEEPDQCTYSVSVCLKDLCRIRRRRMITSTTTTITTNSSVPQLPVASKNFESLLQHMKDQCWITTLSWWTYVFFFYLTHYVLHITNI